MLIFLTACQAEKGPLKFRDNSLPFEANALIRGEAPLGFKSLQKYILEPKCMACHSTKVGRVEPEFDPIDFDTYESTMEEKFIPLLIKGHPEKSRLWEEVE
ncbi:MAG: hypothetical protein KC493_17765, partial [Bacteriovoracaceae bacterium]|nr:hypothetical protein [Bacteriovoracaceae bacterium]